MDIWGGFDSVDDMWGFFNRKTNSKVYGTNSIPFFLGGIMKLSVKRSNEKDLFMKRNEKVDGSPLLSWV